MNFSFGFDTGDLGLSARREEELRRLLVKLMDEEGRATIAAIRQGMRGTKTGKTYKRNGVTWVASAPGESPAVGSTKRLINSLRARKSKGGLRIRIAAEVGYGKILEEGSIGGKIKARPFMKPAKEDAEVRINRGVDRLIQKIKRRTP